MRIAITGRLEGRVKDVAKGQGITYASLVRMALERMLDPDRGQTIPVRFGNEDFADCIEEKNKCGGTCKCK